MGKGVVYYFNYRKFQPALDEYLTAYRYLENAHDPYVKYQNLYHIGVVKSYLGYHDEALQIFKECIAYFEPNTRANIHPNLILNNQKGYLNSLHQMIICYQATGKFHEAKRFTEEAFNKIPRDNTFYLEKSYFEKADGITDFNQKKYEESINKLNRSLPALTKINNFTFLSVVYFYKGQSYSKLGDQTKAVENYKKVDSIFNRHQFILPEIRKNYEELINYYKENNNAAQELYYTKQLLKADKIIANDFKYLSTRIHKDYDTRNLLEAKADLEHTNSYGKILLIGCMLIIGILVLIVSYWSKRKREIQRQYDQMLLKIKSTETSKELQPSLKIALDKSSKLEPLLVQKLLKKISAFEKSNSFLEKGISLNQLAALFETNTSYLSQVINEYKGNNFNTYINTLRISYATEKLYNDKEWRKKSVEDLARDCGFSNRQSFSNTFYELNGIRPADFSKKRKEERELQTVSSLMSM